MRGLFPQVEPEKGPSLPPALQKLHVHLSQQLAEAKEKVSSVSAFAMSKSFVRVLATFCSFCLRRTFSASETPLTQLGGAYVTRCRRDPDRMCLVLFILLP